MKVKVDEWLILTMPDRTWILESVSYEQRHKHRPLQAKEVESHIQEMLNRYRDSNGYT